jgi:DNA-directed RNA polymerase beta subunit
MAETFNGRKRIRKKFGSIREVAEMPNLIEVQKSSYDDFLMVKEPPGGRKTSPASRHSNSCATSSTRRSTTSTSACSAT